MNTRGFSTAAAAALLATALLLPATGQAYDRDRSSGMATVGYRGHHGDRHYGGYRDRGDHHYRHHYRHHGRPSYGHAHGYYVPRTYYYRPYYPSHYYHSAPRHYYGPDSGWSVDLHYFFRD